jgi:transposase
VHTVYHIETFTCPGAEVNTDEWRGYTDLPRAHAPVDHGRSEWARDDDGDGIREVHINTQEGLWTGVCNSCAPFVELTSDT